MSVTFFSIFSPEIFQVEVKNKFLSQRKKLFNKNPKNNLLSTQLNTGDYIDNKTKATYYKTTTNINNKFNKNENLRDIIASKRKPKLKLLRKIPKQEEEFLSQTMGAKILPYKQYILEKRQLENIKKEKNILKLALLNKKYSEASPDKSKIKGINFAKQKGFSFFEENAESKNYSKQKNNNDRRPIFIVRRSKFNEFDLSLLEDIKNNKRKNVFEENFGVKSYLRYDKFRQQTMSFMKFLRENPNYNY